MDVVVVGAGQAGLAVSHALTIRGVDHVVLEADRVASAWRHRWDSFTLVTPNWTLALPDAPYSGEDPEGHVSRDQIVDYLEWYAAAHAGEIRVGVRVDQIAPGTGGRFVLDTSDGVMSSDQVVVCTGAFRVPHMPPHAGAFPPHVTVLDATSYRAPGELSAAGVLVVGSGQTGVQLADELRASGRNVTLACGRAPWAPRRADGVDIITWLARTSYFEDRVTDLPHPWSRLAANAQLTGAGGGHDLHFRVLQQQGVTLAGRLTGVDAGRALFADDLADSVAFGDARYAHIRALVAAELGPDAPFLPDPEPFVATAPTELDLADVGTVIITSGFRPDHARWIQFPVFDELGFPIVGDDLATAVPGLFFCGVHFLRNRRSSLLWGVGDDAAVVADTLARQQ
ncbi:MAG TPA: NAD(P)-binding domain-containing protein [Nocardioidaceae bacterium]|jgi:putative flavoprotein involved in K+ transport